MTCPIDKVPGSDETIVVAILEAESERTKSASSVGKQQDQDEGEAWMVSAPPLGQVLHEVHRFLDLLDVANVLSTCHALRNDGGVATRVLKYNVHSQHFFQGCPLDWFHLAPRLWIEDGHWQRCKLIVEQDADAENTDQLAASGVDRIDVEMMHESFTSESNTSPYVRSIAVSRFGDESMPRCCCHSPWCLGDELTAAPFQPAQLINLVCLVERILLRWCYQPVVVADEVHALRPVVLPLFKLVDDDQDNLHGTSLCRHQVWKESDIRDRLNAAREGTNFKLVAADPHRTCFGVHWDNIQLIDGEVRCACCEAFEPALQEYRDTVSLLYRRWLTTAESCQSSWRAQGVSQEQVEEMVGIVREELLPSHGFFSEVMARASDEDLMTYICTNTNMAHLFNVCPDQPTDPLRYSWKSVFHPTMRSVCCQIIVPLKIASHKRLIHSTRASARWDHNSCDDSGDEINSGSPALPHWSDMVVGVYPAGFLVGFYYMTYRSDAPPSS